MRTSNLPKNLPFLPGNVYADPTITRYHKTQLLGLQNGIITGKLIQIHALQTWSFRENNKFAREHQPRTPRLHARGRRHRLVWYANPPQAREQLHPQDCPQVAQVRSPGKYPSKPAPTDPTRSSNLIYYMRW